MRDRYLGRRNKLRRAVKKSGADAILVTNFAILIVLSIAWMVLSHFFGIGTTLDENYNLQLGPLLAFAALNIVGATLFLRWHWLVDVLAGLALAFGARGFGIWRGRVAK